jgi:hypothetical protein
MQRNTKIARAKVHTHETKAAFALLCVGVIWASGCFIKKTPAKPATMGFTVVLVPPILPPATTATTLEPSSDIQIETHVMPPPLAMTHGAPVRPHTAAQPSPGPATAEKNEEPILAPELTSEELTAAKEETQHNLDMVEKNLSATSGRMLNATQQDLVSKVRGFTGSAREAMRGGDWERARNLSKKAVVLSEQLVASL